MRKIAVSFGRRAAVLCLATAVVNLHLAAALGAPTGASVPPTAELGVRGRVLVDGTPGLSGQTCFSGSTFAVAARSGSTLALRNRARIELSAETTLKLDFSGDGLAGVLEGGRLRVFVPAGVAARFSTAGAVVRSDPSQPALFSLQAERGGGTVLSVDTGRAELSVGDQTRLVGAGQLLSTAGGSQPLPAAGLHLSGKQKVTLGVGFGLLGVVAAIIFTRKHAPPAPLDFGGCVIVLSPGAESDC
jgi:hypothetical protein